MSATNELDPFGAELMIDTPVLEGLGRIACVKTPGTTEQDDTITTLKGEDFSPESLAPVSIEEIKSLV